ncbi:MAG: DUF6599 family protein [Bacteroidales bacterium]
MTVTAGAQGLPFSMDLSALPGVEVRSTRIFTAESLYGYIDGGAELYLEYGFDTLVVTELISDGRDIKVELYRMKDAEAAFGIFSVSRFRCNGGARLTDHMCRSAYQLQFCKGSYYVSIINDKGTEAEQKTTNEITAFLVEHITGPPFNPVGFFEGGLDTEIMKSAVLIRGPLGIYNGIPVLIDAFGDLSGYTALIIRKDQQTVASVFFDSDVEAGKFLKERKSCTSADTASANNGSAFTVITPKHITVTF